MSHIGAELIVSVFMGFFAIMNPFANTPVFLGLTEGDDTQTRRAVARKALIVAFVIVVVFCAAGKAIFNLFGITLSAFRITGGLLVFGIGFQMLQGKQSKEHQPTESVSQSTREDQMGVAVSPLAIPILAGPGTIATAINFSASPGAGGVAVTIVAFLILCLITYVFFISGERLMSFLGDNLISAITRIMGLMLAVIGTQMAMDGIGAAIAASG